VHVLQVRGQHVAPKIEAVYADIPAGYLLHKGFCVQRLGPRNFLGRFEELGNHLDIFGLRDLEPFKRL